MRLLTLLFSLALAAAANAETIKIGVLRTTGSGPVFIAVDKGYFAAEGLDAEFVFFESAQPIAVATASGDIDIGYTGLTGGFYALAGQGALRLVAGGAHEMPGFPYQPFLVSLHAWDAGLHGFKDFPGHSFAVSQIGSPPHYALGLLADKYGFDIKSMRVLPLNSIPNIVAGISSGQADTAMMPGNTAVPLLQKGTVKLLGYAGDETPYQLVGVMVSSQTADTRGPMLEKALTALRRGARTYHDALTPDGKRGDGPDAADMLAIIARDAGQSVEDAKVSYPYCDPEARLDVADVIRQAAWYKEQGMVKDSDNFAAMIDRRYVLPLAMP